MKVRVASAGTGKTASLVLRYLELIACGTPLRRIAGVTFTRKAADELRSRVDGAIAEVLQHGAHLGFRLPEGRREAFVEANRELPGATLTTIHGFMGQCLRLAAPMLHLDPDFALLGDWEARTLFEEEWNSLLYLANDPQHPLHGMAQPELSEGLLHLFSKRSLAEQWQAAEGQANQTLLTVYQSVYTAYEARLGANLLSPSELERKALQLSRQPRALQRVLERVQVLLVDEYQDVNPLQGAFFAALERSGLPIEIVGDPKQSIYAFRNADVEVFRQALQRGEALPPLTQSYRHSQTLVRFLNRLTEGLSKNQLGFGPSEAPPVEGVRSQRGRLEIHWVDGEASLEELRTQEAWVLAQRLKALEPEIPYGQTAVLVRSYGSVRYLEQAFAQAQIPYVLVQGRGYYERQEVRDLYHALKAALDPRGLSLAAWLRSPFGRLELGQVERVVRSEDPLHTLELSFPDLHQSLMHIRGQLRTAAPLEALKFLIRHPLIEGRAYQDFLEGRAKENVDALLFYFAPRPPQSLEGLLERLELLSGQAEAGDVPQSGEGVQVLTVHRAKGLEWPLVAVFDLGRKPIHQSQPLYMAAEAGSLRQSFSLPDTPQFEAMQASIKAAEEQESYRLLYVAASRAKDTLLLTGSVRAGKPEGWAAVLAQLGLGPQGQPFDRPDYLHKTWLHRPVELSTPPLATPTLEVGQWASQSFALEPFPPLFSPSGLKREEAEPLPLPDPTEGEEVPGRARAVGTLVHYAIGQNWQASNPQHLHNLEAQEVMFPFDPDERQGIMEEVKALLEAYQGLLGAALPWPRQEDYPELGMAVAVGSTVWQGVIDRLYRVGSDWILEDYKTDLHIEPQRYHFQLGIYLRAIREAWHIQPQVRLVYLRYGEVVPLDKAELEAAVAEALEAHAK